MKIFSKIEFWRYDFKVFLLLIPYLWINLFVFSFYGDSIDIQLHATYFVIDLIFGGCFLTIVLLMTMMVYYMSKNNQAPRYFLLIHMTLIALTITTFLMYKLHWFDYYALSRDVRVSIDHFKNPFSKSYKKIETLFLFFLFSSVMSFVVNMTLSFLIFLKRQLGW